ncbi:MAG: citrate lyase subunit alpha, partial [Sphaerochaetaceae bacterium]|nr:citrate lyase subunit alpha [Sphaerochaetaceae bacterium]
MEDRKIIEEYAKKNGLTAYVEPKEGKNSEMTETLKQKEERGVKVVSSLRQAIINSGLKDGMTISFHHHFRGGDYIVNMVLKELSEMGYKDIKIEPSSLSDIHKPIIDYIKSGLVTSIGTSGLRGDLAKAISHGLMDKPITFRTHGGRASAIAKGDIHIDVAFLGVSSCDPMGNANGYTREGDGKTMCGSLGYARVDAQYADHVIIITENMVPYPNAPFGISQNYVDQIVLVDSVGDPNKIMSGATRFTKKPQDLLIAQAAADVIVNSGYFYDGFSIQTGSGGASLAVIRFLEEYMEEQKVNIGFALGGITGAMVKLHEKGLIKKILDVQ